jgi:hypothetical protein
MDIGGPGDFVTKVDAKIRRIKERYQSVKPTLQMDTSKKDILLSRL